MTHLDTIKQLRSEGKSWRQIGRVQGTTGQAAWDYHNRYTKPRKIKVFYENFSEAYHPSKIKVRSIK